MAMGKRERDRQPTMWFTMTDLPTAASHPFYRRLNQLLSEHGLVMRLVIGVGTPRGLQGRVAALITLLVSVYHASTAVIIARSALPRDRDRSQPQISLWAGRLIIAHLYHGLLFQVRHVGTNSSSTSILRTPSTSCRRPSARRTTANRRCRLST